MSKYGYVGKESDIPQQAFKANAGVLSVNDHLALSQENKLTQYGQLELIETQTFSGVTAVDFTDIKEDIYNVHFITISNVDFSGGQSSLGIQFYESGVLETASVYQYANQYGQTDGTFGESKSTGISLIYINAANFGFTSTDSGHTYVYLYNLGDSSKYSFLTEQGVLEDSGTMKMLFGSGVLPQASTVDGIRLKETIGGGATVSGTASLYGIRYS